MNIGHFEDFDQYSNGNNGNQYDHGFDPPAKLDSGRGVSSGFNKNSAVDGFSLPHNHMFDIEEDDEDRNDQQYQWENGNFFERVFISFMRIITAIKNKC